MQSGIGQLVGKFSRSVELLCTPVSNRPQLRFGQRQRIFEAIVRALLERRRRPLSISACSTGRYRRDDGEPGPESELANRVSHPIHPLFDAP
jgi:hypothetical protein